jgi:hypothetical protein
MSNDITVAEVLDAVVRLHGAIEVFATRVDGQFGRIETRLTGVETRLTGVENRLTGVENRLTGVENRLTGVERRLTNVEDGLHGLCAEFRSFKFETNARFIALSV